MWEACNAVQHNAPMSTASGHHEWTPAFPSSCARELMARTRVCRGGTRAVGVVNGIPKGTPKLIPQQQRRQHRPPPCSRFRFSSQIWYVVARRISQKMDITLQQPSAGCQYPWGMQLQKMVIPSAGMYYVVQEIHPHGLVACTNAWLAFSPVAGEDQLWPGDLILQANGETEVDAIARELTRGEALRVNLHFQRYLGNLAAIGTRVTVHTHDTLGTPFSRGQECNTPAWWVSVLRAVLGEAARSGGGQHARHLTLIHRDSELLGRVAQRDCHYTLEAAGWVPPGVPSLGVAGYSWRDLQVSRWLPQQPRRQIPWL